MITAVMAEDSFLEVDPSYRSVVLDWFPQLSQSNNGTPNADGDDVTDKDRKGFIQPEKRSEKPRTKTPLPETKEVKVRSSLESIIRKKLKKKRKFEEDPVEIVECKLRDCEDDGDSKTAMVSASKKVKAHHDIREHLLTGGKKKRRRRRRKGNTGEVSGNLEKSPPENVTQEVDLTAKVNECDPKPVPDAASEDARSPIKQKRKGKTRKKKIIQENANKSDPKKEKVVTSRGFILSNSSIFTSQVEQTKADKKKDKKIKKRKSEQEGGEETPSSKKMKKPNKDTEREPNSNQKFTKLKKKTKTRKPGKQSNAEEHEGSGTQSEKSKLLNHNEQSNKGATPEKQKKKINEFVETDDRNSGKSDGIKNALKRKDSFGSDGERRTFSTPEGADTPVKPVTDFREGNQRRVPEEAFQAADQGFGPQRRKRKKRRSKQKNIRKDNRPDHLKPPHLRIKTETSLPVLGL